MVVGIYYYFYILRRRYKCTIIEGQNYGPAPGYLLISKGLLSNFISIKYMKHTIYRNIYFNVIRDICQDLLILFQA